MSDMTGLDPDPLHADEDLDQRVPRHDEWLERQYANDLEPGRSGMVIVYAAAAIILVVLVAAWLATAPRAG